MKLKDARVTILINKDETTIEVDDAISNTKFLIIKLTPEQLCSALSRLSHVECEAEVSGLEKLGKTHENKYFEFEIPDSLRSSSKENELWEIAVNLLKSTEWKPDKYFASQNSFFRKDGKQYARCTIRRWV